MSWTGSHEILFPSVISLHDGSDAESLKEVFQLQFGAGEGAGLEENLAAAQQQMQVMQQVIMMEMVMLLVLSILLLAMMVMERWMLLAMVLVIRILIIRFMRLCGMAKNDS